MYVSVRMGYVSVYMVRGTDSTVMFRGAARLVARVSDQNLNEPLIA